MGKIVPLQFEPGIIKDTTTYSSRGRWVDASLVRFKQGPNPEVIGGWTRLTTSAMSGYIRNLLHFSTMDGELHIAAGTSTHFYIATGGVPDELTPLRATASLTDAVTTTNGSSIITITDTSHGASVGDIIQISGSDDVGGILAAEINTELTVATVVDADNYTVLTTGTASSGVTGGGTMDIDYLLPISTGSQIFGGGWGAGAWGREGWGDPVELSVTAGVGIWDIFSYNAEDLIVHPKGNAIYYWDATAPTTRPVLLSTLGGAADTPSAALKVLVSGFDSHVIAFGTNEIGGSTINPMLLRWSDQESAAVWTISGSTSAGQKFLSKGSTIVAAVQAGDDILIFTDVAVYAMTYVGGLLTFSFELIAEGVDLAGPNAIILLRDKCYWMGQGGFYRLTGNATSPDEGIDIEEIPCTVQDFIFLDCDWSQSEKISCGTNYGFNEIIWFYPSLDSTDMEPDKYVCYNTELNVWYTGTLSRTAWIDSFYTEHPIAAATDGYLYNHEDGASDGSTTPASALNAYIESGPFDTEDGNRFMTVTRILHDVRFRGDDPLAQTMTITLKAFDYNSQAAHDEEESAVTRTAVLPVEESTYQSHVRIRGRQLTLKASSDTAGTSWRLGFPRLEIRSDGQK